MVRKILQWMFLIVVVIPIGYVILLRWVDPPLTWTQLGSLFGGHGLRRDYVYLSEVSPNARLAVMATEDQLFPDHAGFDIKSIEQVLEYNKRKPGRVRGASTISQQVAKNIFLWQGRSWIRKGLEVWFTVLIEAVWGKRRILEVYLNVVEMGTGVFGIEAAARHHFKKSARALTRREAAMIASCLPNPKRYTLHPMSRAVKRRYPWALQQMSNLDGDPDIQGLLK
ncbi:MAG: monofunctional biosynthetic peptidoglycan transglycosylase [Bacteroidetes bacterium]|nr:monofunctional biosynthetic peptidoglycan transglycosylase [Bacteroidota bacterium]